MTSDEALIEKMAEAMWNANVDVTMHGTWADEKGPHDEFGMGSAHEFYTMARAALSVVRENDKMVQAGSTGAVRSTDQSTGKRVVEQFYDIVQNDDVVVYSDGSRISVNRGTGRATLALPREGAAQAETGKDSAIPYEDLDVVVGDLLRAFNDAEEAGEIVVEFDSSVGSRFHQRVKRLADWLLHRPTVDRTSPPAPREPNLPSSLLTRLDVPGGLTKGKRV